MKVGRRQVSIAILLLAVAGVLATSILTSRGPENWTYGGWRLSVWVRHWGEKKFATGSLGTIVIREGTTALDSNAAPYLVSVLHEPDSAFRKLYLRNWEKAPLWLRQHLEPPVSMAKIRLNAIAMLTNTGPGSPETIAALLELAHDDASTNATAGAAAIGAQAIRVLGEIGVNNGPAMLGLSRLLAHSTNLTVQGLAIETLGKIGGGSESAVDALVRAVRDGKRGWNRSAPITALTRMGRAGNLGVPGLIRAINESGDSITCDLAMRGLQELARDQPQAMDALVSFVRRNEKPWNLRWSAMVCAARAKDPNSAGLRAVIAVALDESEGLSSRIEACQVMELVHGRPPSFPGGGVWRTTELLAEMRERAKRELQFLNAKPDQLAH